MMREDDLDRQALELFAQLDPYGKAILLLAVRYIAEQERRKKNGSD